MKKDIQRLILVGLIVIGFVLLGAIYIWAPVCDQFLELANGNMTHMRCFYTAQAATGLILLLLIQAGSALLTKQTNTVTSIMIMALGLMLIAITYESLIGIGVCKKVMTCHDTAFWLRSGGTLIFLAGIGTLIKGKSKVEGAED